MIELESRRATTLAGSRDLLTVGSAASFVDALCLEADGHPAVEHPFLTRLAAGDLPDVPAVLRDYCYQYSFYCSTFPSYLEAVLAGLASPRHRELVFENLREERGEHSGGVPHAHLFRRFRRAAGVTAAYEARHEPCGTVRAWQEQFLLLCRSRPVGFGVGALGIGTERVVARIYGALHQAVVEHTNLTPEDYEFLTVHISCDDGHGEHMREISVELAEDPAQREGLRFGVHAALAQRGLFWDAMLARALAE
jgi:pyrroloquinoline quinone (PQQ) biosynthesis protein C